MTASNTCTAYISISLPSICSDTRARSRLCAHSSILDRHMGFSVLRDQLLDSLHRVPHVDPWPTTKYATISRWKSAWWIHLSNGCVFADLSTARSVERTQAWSKVSCCASFRHSIRQNNHWSCDFGHWSIWLTNVWLDTENFTPVLSFISLVYV